MPLQEDSPLGCRHGNLKLEQDRPGYLTGWYACLDCGERVGMSGVYAEDVQREVRIFLQASDILTEGLRRAMPMNPGEVALVESYANHIKSLIAILKSHETLNVLPRPQP